MDNKVLPDDPDECFYCRRRVGADHAPGCIILGERFGKTYIVFIRKNETGEIVRTAHNDFSKEPADVLYYWTEGNNSCDCNRFLNFERGKGADPDLGDAQCGEGAYSIRVIVNGQTLLDEIGGGKVGERHGNAEAGRNL